MEDKIAKFSGSYRFLSNFYPAEVEYEGLTYKTSEHAYQAAKATNADDRAKIRKAKSPGEAKRMGRRIKIRPDWESVKVEVMRTILIDKFRRNKDLARLLIETEDAHLEEGNTWGDTTWGTVKGKGKNLLGKLLMEVRDLLKAEMVTSS